MQNGQFSATDSYYKFFSLLNSFKISYLNELINELNDQKTKNERKTILRMLLFAVNGLYMLGINMYPNVIELFRINSFRRSSLYYDAIFSIAQKIKHELRGNVEWINQRGLKKGSIKDKNIIFCFLLYTYREKFIGYLQNFLSDTQNDEEKINNLISNLEKIICTPNCIAPLPIKSNKKTIETKQDSSDQNIIKIENEIIDLLSFNNDDMHKNEEKKIQNDKNVENEIILIDNHNFIQAQNHFEESNQLNELSDYDDYLYNNSNFTF